MSTHELEKLLPAHYKIVELALSGHTRIQIATMMERTPEGVGLILNSPVFQDELARRRATHNAHSDETSDKIGVEAQGVLNDGATQAARTLVNLACTADSESVRQSSARDILDRVLEKKEPGSLVKTAVMISVSEAKNLQIALVEAG